MAVNDLNTKNALDCLFDKEYRCPSCDTGFLDRAVKDGSLTLSFEDTDFRKHYEPLDPLLYDVVCCTKCGYSSLAETFYDLTLSQVQSIAAGITPRFKTKAYPQTYTYDIGVMRYKAAIMSALATRAKSGEIAYLYMKLAWIYRSMGKKSAENTALLAACEGFMEAMRKEYAPFINLSMPIMLYIVGDFLYRLSKREEVRLFFAAAVSKKPELNEKIAKHPLITGDVLK
jgi:hypothetical protein